jgi:hypothetical protein
VTWSESSNATTATIDPNSGVLTGIVPGTTTVTASVTTTQGAITSTDVVSIGTAALTRVAVAPSSLLVHPGSSAPLTVTGTYSNGTTANVTAQAGFKSSATAVATVSSTGVVTGVAKGTSAVTVTVGALSATSAVTVDSASLKSLAVTPATSKVALGTTVHLSLTGTYSDMTTAVLTSNAAWSSSNGYASVGNGTQAGLVTGVKPGTSTITAKFGGLSAAAMANVTGAKLISLSLTPANPSTPSGNQMSFTATGAFSDGTQQVLTTQAAWSSSVTADATINTAGVASTFAVGSTTIKASLFGISATTALTVTSKALVGIAVEPSALTEAPGWSGNVVVYAIYTDGSVANVTSSATITSSNTAVATVSGADLSAVAAGTTTIYGRYGGFTASAGLTVT